MPHIVVERSFQSPLTNQELKAVGQRMATCLELYRVKWMRSYLSPDRRRMICEFVANDAESVRVVQQEADAHYDRVWIAEVLEPASSA